MHSLVRRYIKTGIVFLLAGLMLGGWMLVQREFAGRFPTPYLLSAHTHLIAVGFVMQMILGVALWLFPRPPADDQRYDPRLIRIAWWCLTLGTAARALGELSRSVGPAPVLAWVIVLSGLAQITGIALFFFTMWTRVRGMGSKIREERGERF